MLSDEVDFVCKYSDFYTPGDEYGIRWNDPDIGVNWPATAVMVSEKDKGMRLFAGIPACQFPA